MLVSRARAAGMALLLILTAACSTFGSPKYEYEEQVYLELDGRASIAIDGSLYAIGALRGITLDGSASSAVTREDVQRVYESANCRVESVSRPWTRLNRRYARLWIAVDDIRKIADCSLLGWSRITFAPLDEDSVKYEQAVGDPAPGAAEAAKIAPAGWNGSELVAFRLHLPSRIEFHNVKKLDGSNGSEERGNILTWEQRLTDRLAGVPITMTVEMGARSILNRTLWLFGGAFAAAVLLLGGIIWVVVKKARKPAWAPGPKV
jgi:hypothetical protein